ncbi:hypothetical protein G6F57_009114 [Rhizopus arrhizus]|uniref:C2H2-type domain-containing protein n=1 Tax=Rhizopus oryzae TaxID=64495 RepID=A0A9P6X4D7_RHIOR|nr:hypothetical protein G6F23_008751 [Rhizopus arrhizus]KAG1416790.1 hypothetical protein G6F58_005811 [Rhizopus delemar]KAG0759556.1 hypothetical protein G6F24_008979 [Rhizopus arrhizus]KAG0783569.1 hypothetical protein G6F22_008630 [Rhizopus arrhizus]KAG0785728.1 hypothetical protein G6F21_009060 [Rhizopus arrhizus]
MYNNDSVFSIKNALGRQVSLLNDTPSMTSSASLNANSLNAKVDSKRKYHCAEPGCHKSFTTSGHLARHNRIHTGEKNFHCLHPGCPSRFSRQDNMMQHYRTHLSQKARRQQQQLKKPAQKPSSPFYCHSNEGMKLARPMTRPRRSITMPSLPYPMFDARQQDRPSVRPRRALSTSSTCSSSSSFISSSHPSPQFNQMLPPLSYLYQQHYQPVELSQFSLQKPTQWEPKPTEKSLSSLLYLANIVSTFG